MLWSLTAGFLAGLAGVYLWRRRGAILVFVLGVFVGGCAAIAALLFPDPYPPDQAFAAVVGVVSTVLWSFGSAVGTVTSFALWRTEPQKDPE
jgi:peptidoglycan/LPS O-acetylase OafA/YrhL